MFPQANNRPVCFHDQLTRELISYSSSIKLSKSISQRKKQTSIQQNGTAEYCGTDRLFPALISDLNTMKAIK